MKNILIVGLLFLFSCNSSKVKTVEKPADLIPEEKMIQILTDVHLLEATLNVRFPMQPKHILKTAHELEHDTVIPEFSIKSDVNFPLSYFNFFEKEGVTQKQYESSMIWYCSDPEKLSKMYDEVIIELTKRQTQEKLGK